MEVTISASPPMRGVRSDKVECSVPECDRRVFGRGFCQLHHKRWWRHGNPLKVIQPGWTGDNASYAAAHTRLSKERGNANTHTCPCGKRAREWAFDEPTGYSLDFSRYTAMCQSCHHKLDCNSKRES